MDEYAVLVFRDQPFTDAEQLDFAQRLDGQLHTRTGAAVVGKSRLGNEALTDISNLDETGEVLAAADRRRMYALGNRLWHTDASFVDPPGRYSMLSARIVRGYEAPARASPSDDPRHRRACRSRARLLVRQASNEGWRFRGSTRCRDADATDQHLVTRVGMHHLKIGIVVELDQIDRSFIIGPL